MQEGRTASYLSKAPSQTVGVEQQLAFDLPSEDDDFYDAVERKAAQERSKHWRARLFARRVIHLAGLCVIVVSCCFLGATVGLGILALIDLT